MSCKKHGKSSWRDTTVIQLQSPSPLQKSLLSRTKIMYFRINHRDRQYFVYCQHCPCSGSASTVSILHILGGQKFSAFLAASGTSRGKLYKTRFLPPPGTCGGTSFSSPRLHAEPRRAQGFSADTLPQVLLLIS